MRVFAPAAMMCWAVLLTAGASRAHSKESTELADAREEMLRHRAEMIGLTRRMEEMIGLTRRMEELRSSMEALNKRTRELLAPDSAAAPLPARLLAETSETGSGAEADEIELKLQSSEAASSYIRQSDAGLKFISSSGTTIVEGTLEADTIAGVQLPVDNTCSEGSSIRTIAADGTVECEPAGSGPAGPPGPPGLPGEKGDSRASASVSSVTVTRSVVRRRLIEPRPDRHCHCCLPD